MSRTKTCRNCDGRMQEGRAITKMGGYLGHALAWVVGIPKRSMWTGIRASKYEVYDIVTYRCGKCGLLESYGEK